MAKETYERLTNGLTAEAKRKKLDEALNTVALKYMVHYYEDMRLFTGYAGQYPDMANFFKRIQSLSSSGTPLVNDVDTNQAVIRANKKDRFVINGVEKTYGDDSLKLKGIIKEKPLVGPVVSLTDAEKQVLKDIYVNGLVNQDRVPADIANKRAEEWTSAFEEYEEADGATYTNMFFFREYKDRLGQWSQGQENTFQVELAILNQNTLNPTVYVSEDLKVSARPETGYEAVKIFDFRGGVELGRNAFNTLEPMTMLKPIYAGPVTHQEVTVNGIRKTSFHLITPSMAMGTGKLKEIHDYMLLNDTDIVPLDSATKKAVPINIENIDSFGNEENGFSYLMVEFLKEQVPVSNKEKGRIKNATQSTTIMLSNLYINGVPKDYAGEDFDALSEEEKVKQSNIYKNVKAYRDALYTVIDQSIDNVRNALGIDESEKITKVERIKSALTEQVTQPNLLDAIQQFEETITHLDLLPGFNRLEPVAFSLISNEAIRIKRPGEMAAQYSVYGFGNEDVAGQRSKRLNTYRLSEGKVLPAEVIVPLPMSMVDTLLQMTGTNRLDKAIEKYKKGENKIIIKGLRIPNQQLSFNGIYAIKEFALPTMQNYIVLPSEIVPISSSDFDIDKQQLYLPILDSKGKLSKDKKHKAYNDLLQSEIDLLLMTENLHTLLAPVNESWLSIDLFVDVLTAKGMFKGDKNSKKDREAATIPLKFQDFGNITKQIQNGVNMAQSKINVGLVANNAKQYPIGMLDKWNATPTVIVDDRKVANKLPFAQDLKHYYAMYDSKYRHVVETISTILTSQVDGVKNPYAVLMNIGQRTIGPLMLMVRRGVDADLAIKMLSSPLIEKYTKAQDLFDSTLAKSRGLKKKVTSKIAGQTITTSNLLNMVLTYAEQQDLEMYISQAEKGNLNITEAEINQALTESTTEAAYKVLAAYIYTETLADEQLSVTTAATPDTKPARNAEMLDVFNERMLDLRESSMIDKNLKQGFLSKFYEVQKLYDYLYQFYFMRNNAIGSAVATQLAPAIAARIYGNDRKVKAMRTIVSDFKAFMLIKAFMKEDATLYSFNNLVLGTGLTKEIDKLLKEGEPQMRDNYLLNQLQKVEIGQDPSNPENKLNLLQLKDRGSSSLYLYDVYDSFNDLPKSLQFKMIAYNTYVTGFMFSPFTLDDVINPAVSAEIQKKMLEPTQEDFNEFASIVAQLNPSLFYNKARKGSEMAMKYNNYQLKDKELMSGGTKVAKLGNNYAKRYDGKGYTKIELEVSKPATATNVADVLKDECNMSGLKAQSGMSFGFTPGNEWEIIKNFKGPSHEYGGIDILVKGGTIKMSNKDGDVKAPDGLVVAAKPPVNSPVFATTPTSAEIDNLVYSADLPEIEIKGKAGGHKDVRFTDYSEPFHVQEIRTYQTQKQLKPTGTLDKDTLASLGKKSNAELNEALALRESYKSKVKEQGAMYKPGDDFSMKPDTFKKLSEANVKQLSHCIGGVCRFLDEKVEPGIFKGGFTKKGFDSGTYFSNTEFEAAHKKEGWQRHKNYDLTTPDTGDILRVSYPLTRRNHAMLVIDKQENKKDSNKSVVTVIDNAGEKEARVRKFTLEELNKKFNRGSEAGLMELSFYRRTKFQDKDIAELQRQQEIEIPEAFKPYRLYTPTKVLVEPDNKVTSLSKPMQNFIKGINETDVSKYTDIAPSHLQTIALISAGIPKGESEEGEGLAYKAEASSRLGAKLLRKVVKGTDLDKTLSVGLSQINPAMLSQRIKDQYFKGLKDNAIERKINTDETLQGKITFEVMVDRYRMFRDSGGSRYGNDPKLFWYALINSWQNPSKATQSEQKLQDLKNFKWDYSNNIINSLDRFTSKIIE
jgi:hypothetical protein